MILSYLPMKKELMVVDDDEDFREMTQMVLTAEGYSVTAVDRGEKALELLKGGKLVDAVLLDLRMPGMCGEEVLDRLREFSEVPVMVVTADVTAKTKSLLKRINRLLEKPFELDKLLVEVKTLTSLGKEPKD